jgi:hypothetical protein
MTKASYCQHVGTFRFEPNMPYEEYWMPVNGPKKSLGRDGAGRTLTLFANSSFFAETEFLSLAQALEGSDAYIMLPENLKRSGKSPSKRSSRTPIATGRGAHPKAPTNCFGTGKEHRLNHL